MPLSLHGDACPVTGVGKSWGKSMDFFSWASLLFAGGTTLESNFLITAMFKTDYSKIPLWSTWRVLWRVIAWSFEAFCLPWDSL